MSSALLPEASPVAVFAKAPHPGAVKTRLAATLGDEGAAALHAQLVVRAVETALAAGLGPVELWCAPDTSDPFFATLASRYGVALRRQEGDDLGARMEGAFRAAFAREQVLLVIGADCPALEPEDLRDAASALARHDAVLAPAEDGGYVLVGLARAQPIFAAMPWGGPQVMERTRERLRAAGASWHELRMLWDVDRPPDLARLQQSGLLARAAG